MATLIELTNYGDKLPLIVNMDNIIEAIGLPEGGSHIIYEITKKGLEGFTVVEPIGKIMQLIREAQK